MPKYSLTEQPSAELWGSLLKTNYPLGNFLQSFEYGEMVKTAYPRARVVRLVINYDQEPIAFAQGTYNVYYGFGTTLTVTWGPIVSLKISDNLHPVENLVSAFEIYCKKHRVIEASFSVFASSNFQEIFRSMNYNPKWKENEYVVNLEGGAEQLFKNIHHNKRRNIKQALEKGVEVTRSHSDEDLRTFYSLLDVTVKREGFTPYPRGLFEAIWNDYDPELSSVFLAKLNGKSISGVFVVVHGKTAYALNAGSLVEGREVRPNDIMHWKAMEWACERGYLRYNLGGVSEPPPTEGSSKWGIWRWKKEWKGNLERIDIISKIVLPQYEPVLHSRDFVQKAIQRFK